MKTSKEGAAAGVDAIFVLPRRDLQNVPFPEANVNGMKKAGVDVRYSQVPGSCPQT